jgi:hypothetical protein
MRFARFDIVLTSKSKGDADARSRENPSIRADFNDRPRVRDG